MLMKDALVQQETPPIPKLKLLQYYMRDNIVIPTLKEGEYV